MAFHARFHCSHTQHRSSPCIFLVNEFCLGLTPCVCEGLRLGLYPLDYDPNCHLANWKTTPVVGSGVSSALPPAAMALKLLSAFSSWMYMFTKS